MNGLGMLIVCATNLMHNPMSNPYECLPRRIACSSKRTLLGFYILSKYLMKSEYIGVNRNRKEQQVSIPISRMF